MDSMVVVRLLCLAGLLAAPVAAAWQRHFMTAKGEHLDTPEPHPLSYFTTYPIMRFEDWSCYRCNPEQSVIEAKKTTVSSKLTLLGNLAGFGIYQLYYHFEDRDPSLPDTKLILVKTGADEYREIYHREPTQVDALCLPSRLITVGDDEFLEAQYVVGGKSQPTIDDYFWFDKSGSTLVDFSPIITTAKSALPAGKEPIWIYDMDKTPGTHYLWTSGAPLIARVRLEDGGLVEVEFKFERGKVIPTKTSYNPAK
jgi:hypothetical protein